MRKLYARHPMFATLSTYLIESYFLPLKSFALIISPVDTVDTPFYGLGTIRNVGRVLRNLWTMVGTSKKLLS